MACGVDTLEHLSDAIKANPDMIDEILVDKFDLSAFLDGAASLGFGASDEDIEDYLTECFPSVLSGEEATYYMSSADSEELRELTPEEAEAAAGGTTVVAAVVAVYAIVYLGAVISVAAVINAGAFAGVGAFAFATVITTVGGSTGY